MTIQRDKIAEGLDVLDMEFGFTADALQAAIASGDAESESFLRGKIEGLKEGIQAIQRARRDLLDRVNR